MAPFYKRQVTPQPQQAHVDDDLVAASVRVSVPGGMGSGTVVFVGEDKDGHRHGLIITCKHVVAPGSKGIKVTFPDGKRVDGNWLASSDRDDLTCISFFADESTPVIPVADTEPPKGADVAQVGYPGPLTKRRGRIAWFESRIMVVTFQFRPGDSGGGVFAGKALCGVARTSDGGCVSWRPLREFMDTRCLFWCKPRTTPSVPPIAKTPPASGLLGLGDLPRKLALLEANLQTLGKRLDDFDNRLKKMDAAVDKFSGVPDQLKRLEDAAASLAILAAQVKPGPAGKDGRPGVDGKDGAAGTPGPAGPQGPAGKDADAAALQTQIDAIRADLENLNGAIFKIKVAPKTPGR